jgi:hypothetical protein
MAKTWAGDPPECDLCGKVIASEFSDAKVPGGRWGILCSTCAFVRQVKYGTGQGQLYKKQGDKWVKVKG